MIDCIIPIKQVAVDRTTCIYQLNGIILVGQSNGDLLVFNRDAKLLRSINLLDHSIEYVGDLPANRTMVVYSGGLIHLYQYSFESDVFKLEFLNIIPNSRCDLIGTFQNIIYYSLKKALYLTKFNVSDDSLTVENLQLDEKVVSVDLLSQSELIIGMVSTFVVLDTKTLQISQIDNLQSTNLINSSLLHSIFSYSKKFVVGLPQDQALIINDSSNLQLDVKDKQLSTSNVQLAETPIAIAFIFPYLLIAYNNFLQVVDYKSGNVLQKLDLQITRMVIQENELIFIVSNNQLHLYKLAAFGVQLDQLTSSKDIPNAINLLNHLNNDQIENKSLRLRSLQVKEAKALFKEHRFTQSMNKFIEYMAEPHQVLSLYPDFISTLKAKPTIFNDITRSDMENGDKESMADVKLLKTALRSLVVYLTDTRRNISRLFNGAIEWKSIEVTAEKLYKNHPLEEVAELVDTSLFFIYLIINQTMISPLLRVKNYCNSSIVIEKLKSKRLYKELIDYYYTQNFHEDSLSLLYTLSKMEGQFHGPSPTIQYLNKLNNDNIDLVLKYSKWPLSLDPCYVKRIFLNESLQCESLDKLKVMNFLISYDIEMGIEYLEYITVEHQVDRKMITKLGELYILKISSGETQTDTETSSQRTNTSIETKQVDNKLQNLDSSIWFTKLYEFLNSDVNYEPRTILNKIPMGKPYMILKVLIYKKLGEHYKNLDILTDDLEDDPSAINYCNSLYEENNTMGVSLFMKLLDKSISKDNHNTILEILYRHGSKLPILEVLDKIPANFKINELSFLLSNSINEAMESNYNLNLSRNLNKVRLIKLEHQTLNLQKQKVTINESRLCRVCGNRLNNSVLNFFPDGSVVHYGCKYEMA